MRTLRTSKTLTSGSLIRPMIGLTYTTRSKMWLKNLFNTKNKMVANAHVQDIKDSLSKYTKFQWVKSERVGTITELKDVVQEGDTVWVEFADGSRINHH